MTPEEMASLQERAERVAAFHTHAPMEVLPADVLWLLDKVASLTTQLGAAA